VFEYDVEEQVRAVLTQAVEDVNANAHLLPGIRLNFDLEFIQAYDSFAASRAGNCLIYARQQCMLGQQKYTVIARYLVDHLIPASDTAPRRCRLCSANLNHLTVPRCRLSTYGCRAFYYAGPAVWNSLRDELRNSDSFDSFKRFLKTILFSRY